MSEKIKVIVKRPDEKYGHVTHMSNTLENFQRVVDGPIETVRLTDHMLMIVNEVGKLRGLPKNFRASKSLYANSIVGTIVLVGIDGEEFADCPIEFRTWKRVIDDWK